jgi:protein SCO1/2
MSKLTSIFSLAGVFGAMFCCAAIAQPMMPAGGPGGGPQSITPDKVVQNVSVDQKLDNLVSPDITFKDETGKTVRLGDYYGKKPILITPVYYECPGLCTMTLNGVSRALNALKFTPGKDFEVLTFSFDPHETPELAAAKKTRYLAEYRKADAKNSWHFLTGDQANIDALCNAIGFKYAYDDRTKQFAHASVIMLITPQGHVSRYFYGLDYSTRDIEMGLVEASQGKIGTATDAAI